MAKSPVTGENTHEEKICSFYDNQLKQIFDLTGESAYGIIYIITGVLNEKPIEWWDSIYLLSQPSEALSRLTDESLSDFLPLNEDAFAKGFFGKQWLDTSFDNLPIPATEQENNWFNVSDFLSDPEYSDDVRLQLLFQAGIGVLSTIPYTVSGIPGISIFGARVTANQTKLQSACNMNHLYNFNSLFSSSVITKYSSLIYTEKKQKEVALRFRKVLNTLAFVSVSSSNGIFIPAKPELTTKEKLIRYLKKFKGSGAKSPPLLPTRHLLICVLGTFISCLLWSIMNEQVRRYSNGKYNLVRGSFGSFVASQYLLFGAPASQPWNAICSQVLCAVIAKLIFLIPHMPSWVRPALIPSLVIFAMGKTGTLHAPTGGDALHYAVYGFDWFQLAAVLFNYAYAIAVSAIINNFNVDRQYPYYWTPALRFNPYHCISFPKLKSRQN